MANILTKKYGPLPAYAWAGLAVAGFLILRARKASKATTAGAPAATMTSSAPSLPYAQAPSGYGYQGPGAGFGGMGPIPTGATAATNTGPSGVQGVGPTGQQGTFYNTSANYSQLLGSGAGNDVYYDAGGGVFLPVTQTVAAQGLATGKQLAIGPSFQ